jgi:hypothetical protein
MIAAKVTVGHSPKSIRNQESNVIHLGVIAPYIRVRRILVLPDELWPTLLYMVKKYKLLICASKFIRD